MPHGLGHGRRGRVWKIPDAGRASSVSKGTPARGGRSGVAGDRAKPEWLEAAYLPRMLLRRCAVEVWRLSCDSSEMISARRSAV